MSSPIQNFGEIHKSLDAAYETAKNRALAMVQFAHQRVEDAERAAQMALDAATDLEVAAERLVGEAHPTTPMMPLRNIGDVLQRRPPVDLAILETELRK